MSFTIGSLFDGSGGFPLAAFMCGGTPVWASEIEPYPIAVTKTRFPYMKHLGSVTDIKGNEVDPVDVITFGSPCQDLSVAGKRAGLKHTENGDEETTRSGLFMEAVRIIKEMRSATNGKYPRFAVWENVPGAFSSNRGEDFRIVLEELIKIAEPAAVMPPVPAKCGWPYADSYTGNGWSLAYRVLDAQYWGVPQRRRRIYLVLDLGGLCARKILFEREGLRGYFKEGRTPWQTAPGDAESCSGTADCEGAVGLDIYNGAITGDIAASLTTATGQGASNTGQSVCIPVFAIDQQGGKGGANYAENVMPTLCSDSHGTPRACACGVVSKGNGEAWVIEEKHMALSCGGGQAGQGYPCIMQSVVDCHILDDQGGSQISVRNDGKCPTLKAEMHGIVPCVIESAAVYNGENITSPLNRTNPKPGDPCHTLSTDSRNYVVEPVYCLQGNGIDRSDTAGCNGKGVKEDVCYTLNTIDRPAVAFQTYQKVTGPLMANSHPGSYTGQDAFSDMIVAGVDARNATEYPELTGSLQADAAHNLNSNNVVRIQYIVRRLTPTECARLQGFPDTWGHPDVKTEFADEEYEFWCKVNLDYDRVFEKARPNDDGWYNVWREVKPNKAKGEDFEPYWEDTGNPYTHKAMDQMLKWYNKLHTDSAEYKLWGNGIAIPCALYVMQGISEAFLNRQYMTPPQSKGE